MRIHFIIKTNRDVEYEILDLRGQRNNGVYMITNARLTKIEKESINDVIIYGQDEKNIVDEMQGQISDGLFENNKVEVLQIIKEMEK